MCSKGSKVYSITPLKCPRCHEGDMFETGSWSFVRPFDMLDRCPACDLNYSPEPGYYYGAMFVSYIWTAGFSLIFVAIFHWYLHWSVDMALLMLSIFMAVNFVYTFRISRLMWINLHVKYDSAAVEKRKSILAAPEEVNLSMNS